MPLLGLLVAQGHGREGQRGGFLQVGQLVHRDVLACGQQGGTAHHVLHLAQVSRPMILLQGLASLFVEAYQVLVHLAVGLVEEEVGKEQDVFAALLERGHAQGELVDAVVQVFTKGTLFDGLLQVFVGGGDEPDVYLNLAVGAHGAHHALLQGAQQLYLHLVTEVSYLVQEDGAAIGRHKGSCLVAQRAGESALDVAEKLGSSQFLGDGAAIDGHERLPRPPAEVMDAMGHILLTRAAGTVYQHRHVGGCHQPHIVEQLLGHFTLSLQEVRLKRAIGRRTFFGQAIAFLSASRRQCFARRGIQGLRYLLQQFVGIHRLGHIVTGTHLHGFYRRLDVGITCHYD